MSHLPHSHQDTILDEEKTIPVSEPPHTTPPPIPPTDPYSTFLTSVHNLCLSHTHLHDEFYSMVTHFAISQRLVEMHLVQIQNHLGYQMPLLLSICIFFYPRIHHSHPMIYGPLLLLVLLLLLVTTWIVEMQILLMLGPTTLLMLNKKGENPFGRTKVVHGCYVDQNCSWIICCLVVYVLDMDILLLLF